MREARTVVLCGLAEREEALLRLLLKRMHGALRESWEIGDDEESADALLVDPETIAGNVAIATAKRRGVPYLVLSSRPRPGEERWTILRPPSPEQVARVFNDIPSRELRVLPVVSATAEDFYNLDLDANDGAPPIAEPASRPPSGEMTPEDAEALFKRDPLSTSVAVLKAVRLPKDLTVERAQSPSPRHELRALESGTQRSERDPEGALPISGDALARESFSLARALEGGILFAPCECRRGDGPHFALVPKDREVLTPAPLSAFRMFRRTAFSRQDFLTLTRQRLAELRAAWTVFGFRELAFVCALDEEARPLDPSLDPGGRFWIEGELLLDASLPEANAILNAMRQPARLHEIAASSGRPLARVIDVVNALKRIGMLGSTLRDRLR